MNPKRKALIRRLLKEAGEDARGAEGSGLSQDDINAIQQDLSDVVEKWLKDNLRPALPDGAKWGMAIAVGRRERSLFGGNPSVDFIGANFSGFLRDQAGIDQGKLKKDLRKHIKKVLKNNRGDVKDASGQAFDYKDLKWDASGRNRLVLPLPVSGGKPKEIITDNETNRTIPVNPNHNRKKDREQGGSGGPRPPSPTPRRSGGRAKENKCVRDLQELLVEAGFGRGLDNDKKPYEQREIDGRWGTRTRQAFYTFMYETNRLIDDGWSYETEGGVADGQCFYSAGWEDWPCVVMSPRPVSEEAFHKELALGSNSNMDEDRRREIEEYVERFDENARNPDRDYWKEILEVYGLKPNFEGLCELVEKCKNDNEPPEPFFGEEEEEEGGGGGPTPPGPTPPTPTPVTPSPGPGGGTPSPATTAPTTGDCEVEIVNMSRDQFSTQFASSKSVQRKKEINLYNHLSGQNTSSSPCGLDINLVYTWQHAIGENKTAKIASEYVFATYAGTGITSTLDIVEPTDGSVQSEYDIVRSITGPSAEGDYSSYTSLYYDPKKKQLYVDSVFDDFIIKNIVLVKNKSDRYFLRTRGSLNESRKNNKKLIKEFKKYLKMV